MRIFKEPNIPSSKKELEFRLGHRQKFFNPDIKKEVYDKCIVIMNNLKWNLKYNEYVDIYSLKTEKNRIRSRYLYSSEYDEFIHMITIIKNNISKTTLDLEKILQFDLRVSLSAEDIQSFYLTRDEDKLSHNSSAKLGGDCFKKERFSYISQNKHFSVDITCITEGLLSNGYFSEYDKNKQYQVEIELLNKNTQISEIMEFITFLSIKLDD